MSFTTDIQTIAKTRLLEEKVGKALNLAEIANQAAAAALLGERSTANQTASPAVSPPNGPPVTNVDGSTPVATGSTGTTSTPSPAPISIIPPVTKGTVVTSTVPVSNPNSTQGLKSASGGGATSAAPTDLASSTTGGGTPGVNGANGGAPIGGSILSDANTALTTDPVAIAINNQGVAQGLSPAEIAASVNSYIQGKYGEPGQYTANDIANGNKESIPIYGNTIDNSLVYGGTSVGNQALSSITGWDPLGTVSPVTGLLQSVVVRFDGFYPSPNYSDSERLNQQAWTGPNSPPSYIGWQFGFIWDVPASSPTAYSSSPEGAALLWVAQTNLTLYNASFTNLRVYQTSLGVPISYKFDVTYYDAPGENPIHKFTATLITGRNASSVDPAAASLIQPIYTSWPQTGVYALSLINGLFQPNQYDGEAPFASKYTASSTALLAVGDGVNVISDKYLQASLGVNGGFLTTILDNSMDPIFANYYNSEGVLTAPNLSPSSIPYYKP